MYHIKQPLILVIYQSIRHNITAYLLAVLLTLIVPSVCMAGYCGNWGKSGSAPWTVSSDEAGTASAAVSDVSACVNTHAAAEDTVSIAKTGTVEWAENLDITQGITLIGPGRNSLTIQAGFDYSSPSDNASYLIVYNPSSPQNDYAFRLSGITLDGNDRSLLLRLYTGTSTYKQTKVRIDHCGFINPIINESGTDPAGCRITGMIYGVIDNNYFDPQGQDGWRFVFDNGSNTETQFESESYSFGQSEALFFEDNQLVDLLDEAFDMSMVSKVVIRYNTFSSIRVGGMAWMEVHGSQCGGNWAGLGFELYGNSFTSVAPNRLVVSRSSKHFVFGNKLNNPSSVSLLVFNPMNAPDSASGGNLCEGTYDSQSNYHVSADGQMNYPTGYFWNNKDDADEVVASIYGYECCTASVGPYGPWPDCCFRDVVDGKYTTGITENKDFFNYNASFDGTAGMGCGSGDPPACASGCTIGVGYWKTTQECGTLTNMVGHDHTVNISGILYILTAPGTWTAYTPYTYPHPLRGTGKAAASLGSGASMSIGAGAVMTLQ